MIFDFLILHCVYYIEFNFWWNTFVELGSEYPRRSGSIRSSKKAVDKEDAVEPVGEEKESKEDDGSKSLNHTDDGFAISSTFEKSINLSTNLENIENPSESVLTPPSSKKTPNNRKVPACHTREEGNTEVTSTQGSEQTNEKNQLTPHRKSSRLFQKGKLNGRLNGLHHHWDDIWFYIVFIIFNLIFDELYL